MPYGLWPLPKLVHLLEDLDGLSLQLLIDRLVVLIRELAHLVVELGVLDLAVLRLLGGLEGGAVVVAAAVDLRSAPQRPEHDEGHDERKRDDGQRELHGWKAR